MTSEGRRIGTEGEPDVKDGLSIQAASRLLQVPAPTIRSWERRYGIPTVSRSAGGHRRFMPDELKVLRRMRDEVARGRRAADAAAIVRAAETASPRQPLIDAFVDAAHRLDPRSIEALLDDSRKTVGLDDTIDDVLLPAMRQIGQWWESGRCDVAHEHLATEAVRGWLNRQLQQGLPPEQPETIILCCGPRDFHTLGLESFGLLLSQRGWSCRVLGARTPVSSLPIAVQATGSAAVILVSHLAVGRRSAVDALRATEPIETLLFYAGNAFVSRQARVGVPGTYLGESFSQATSTVTAAIKARRATQ